MLPPCKFSDKVEEMEKKLEPYFSPKGGIREDAPEEIQKIFKEYQKQVREEAWY